MNVVVERGRHHPLFDKYVRPSQRDLYHESDVISAFYDDWYSIVVHDGHHALANAVAPKRIGKTTFFDVEPIVGYAGLVATSNDTGFLDEALFAYSDACRKLGIVAELIRFDPLLGNHIPFLHRNELRVVHAKDVVVVPCYVAEDTQFQSFSPPCRRRLRIGMQALTVQRMDLAKGLSLFKSFYEDAIQRLGAAAHWHFQTRFYELLMQSERFEIVSVWRNGDLASAALVGKHDTAHHYVLAANAVDPVAGAGERLIYELTRQAAAVGVRWLMLGGGVGSGPDDPLFRFKSRFSTEVVPFQIGQMVHDSEPFEQLVTEALRISPEMAESAYFLKYRHVNKTK